MQAESVTSSSPSNNFLYICPCDISNWSAVKNLQKRLLFYRLIYDELKWEVLSSLTIYTAFPATDNMSHLFFCNLNAFNVKLQ